MASSTPNGFRGRSSRGVRDISWSGRAASRANAAKWALSRVFCENRRFYAVACSFLRPAVTISQQVQSSLSNSLNNAPKFDIKKSSPILSNIQNAPKINGNTGIAGGLNKKIDLNNLKTSLPLNKNVVNVLKKDNLGSHIDVSN